MKYYISVMLITLSINSSCQTLNTQTNMDTIKFIPKEFHGINLGLNEGNTNKCTPGYPNSDFMEMSQIKINIPSKIILSKKLVEDPAAYVIPLCGMYMISNYRAYRNEDKISLVHIRKKGEIEWISGVIGGDTEEEYPDELPPELEEGLEKERQERIKEAKAIPDENLDTGQGGGGPFNINIMDFVTMPLLPGLYEVYVSMYGLESNRVIVEIVFEE